MTREEKALKIAEFEGNTNCVELSPLEKRFIKHGDYIMPDDYNKLHFSSFNGLMPIVEKVNKDLTNATEIIINSSDVKLIMNGDTAYFEIKYYKTLLDALQEAIIYYYENKESGE